MLRPNKARDGTPRRGYTVALAGNPNVGKSTLFNALTGLRQHTGNWAGKTVGIAEGRAEHGGSAFTFTDLPGAYSLLARSAEEAAARDFLCFEKPDAVVVICDATRLERSLNLVLQTLELTERVVVCVNLMDEARRQGIEIDLTALSARLGAPVVAVTARSRAGLDALMEQIGALLHAPPAAAPPLRYSPPVEDAISLLLPAVTPYAADVSARWLALRLLEGDNSLCASLAARLGLTPNADENLRARLAEAWRLLSGLGIEAERLRDLIAACPVYTAEAVCRASVRRTSPPYSARDQRLDRVLTSRRVGFPIMFLLLALALWITLIGANYPSALLSRGLFRLEAQLSSLCLQAGLPALLWEPLVCGVYRVAAWVVAVMLPPMAIFFPLFTLLEDLGYLPRVAYNLDRSFKACGACGKQALCMCMGLGCNAAGVTGCRIIDSPRERLVAILTNSFVPCNGRFPALISILTIFFAGTAAGGSVRAALLLALLVTLGVGLTLLASRLLSATLLKGVASSFTLELPPYRIPQVGRVVVRSVLDRTLFVLGRAVCAAAPAGLLIWALANTTVGGVTLLARCSGFLDPFARLMGLDGVILLAFLLGLPANEIVLPIAVMAYLSQGVLTELTDLAALRALFLANGWNAVTGICFLLFSLLHWPCATTCLTIKKETGSLKWTAVAFLLPTLFGVALCMLVSGAARLLGLA